MGRIFSCLRKPKKNVRTVQVSPAGNLDDGPQKIDYGVFCAANNQSSTTGKEEEEEGKKMPQKVEMPKALVSEKKAMDMLKEEGLVTKLKGLSSKGLAFEIVQEQRAAVEPPARLGEMMRKREKRTEPTEAEIKERLFEAERRRKQLEEERIVKVRSMTKTETAGTIQAYIQKQKALEDQQTKNMDDAVASRHSHLCEIRDRLREKRRHEKQVRQRKELNLDDMGPPPPEERSLAYHRSYH